MAKKTSKLETEEVKSFWDKEVPIIEFQKSNAVQVRVKYVEKKNDDPETPDLKGIDIREWYKKKGDEEYNPSSKGTVIPLVSFPEVYEAMGKFYVSLMSGEMEEEEVVKPKKKTARRKRASGE